MRPYTLIASVFSTCLLMFSTVAVAAPVSGGKAVKKEESAPPAKSENKQKTVDMTEDVIFERLTGLYFEGRGGVFFTVGGARGYSNGQPFFGFEIGYDLTDWFSLQLAYAQGYQAANPVMYPENCGSGPECNDYHLDFGMTFFNISGDFDMVGGRRWALEARVGGGVALIDPSAKPDQGPVDGNVLAGLRFEYYTLLRHFSVGVESDYYLVIPTMIHSVAISFSILYNF